MVDVRRFLDSGRSLIVVRVVGEAPNDNVIIAKRFFRFASEFEGPHML